MLEVLENKNIDKTKKGFFGFKNKNGELCYLTLKEKKFSDLYLELGGNGTNAAYEVYNCNNRRTAASVASENLTKPNICAYVESKMEEYGYSDENVKKQHLFVLNQMSNLSAKNKAIDMYYKVTGEYAPEKREHNVKDTSLSRLLDEIHRNREPVVKNN